MKVYQSATNSMPVDVGSDHLNSVQPYLGKHKMPIANCRLPIPSHLYTTYTLKSGKEFFHSLSGAYQTCASQCAS